MIALWFLLHIGSGFSNELSGYIDISMSREGKTDGSKLFYWFTPAQQKVADDLPLVIWLQGGPGSSGQLGLFYEIGPYYLNDKLELENRNIGNWNKEYNLLFLDQPIGTGYSVAGSSKSYATTQDEVAQDLYFFLKEWYKRYPAYEKSAVYITGESYGGHYIPAFANKILLENQASYHNYINLKGVAIGDGLTDPCSQVGTGPRAAYDFGIIDAKTFAKSKISALKAAVACEQKNWTAAHVYREEMEELVIEASGVNKYDVRTFDNYDYMHERMDAYLNLATTKDMLNVPQEYSFATDDGVSLALYDDVMQSQKDKFPFLLSNIRVLLYQGQFDWKDGPFSNEIWINQIDWPLRAEYLSAERRVWKVTDEATGQSVPSGWVQSYDNLTELIVSSAGHLAPMNQPSNLLSMITTFIRNQPL